MFLLGAGISAASGMPLFRSKGPKSTLCDGRKAIMKCADALKHPDTWTPYFNNVRSADACMKLLGHYKVMAHFFLLSENAPRSAFHEMLAHLAAEGKIRPNGIVTTNIDGLEVAAGVPEDLVVAVHGTVRKLRCLQCGEFRPMTAEIAQRIIDAPYSAKPVDVVPVHEDCPMLLGSHNRQRVRRELLLFRPYVYLYGEPSNERGWAHGIFPMFPLPSRTRANFTLVVAGSSLKTPNAKNWVKDMQEKAKAIMVVNTTAPAPLSHRNRFLFLGSTETVAGWTMPGYRPVRPRPPRHINPCTMPVNINGVNRTCPDPRLLPQPSSIHEATSPEAGPSGTFYEPGPSRRSAEIRPATSSSRRASRSRSGTGDLYSDSEGSADSSDSFDVFGSEAELYQLGPTGTGFPSFLAQYPHQSTDGHAEWSFDDPIDPVIDLTDDNAWDGAIDLTYE